VSERVWGRPESPGCGQCLTRLALKLPLPLGPVARATGPGRHREAFSKDDTQDWATISSLTPLEWQHRPLQQAAGLRALND
jgi:hypothetical protein